MKEIEEQIILDVLNYLPGWTIQPITRPSLGQPRTFIQEDPLDPHKEFQDINLTQDIYDGVVPEDTTTVPPLNNNTDNTDTTTTTTNTEYTTPSTEDTNETQDTYTKQYKPNTPESYDPQDYDTYNTRKHIPPHEILFTYKKTIRQATTYINREHLPNTNTCYEAVIMWTAGNLQRKYNTTEHFESDLIKDAKEMILPYFQNNFHSLHSKPRIKHDPFCNPPHTHHHHKNTRHHYNPHDEKVLNHLYDDYMYLDDVVAEVGDSITLNCELRGVTSEPNDKIKFYLETKDE